MTGVPGHRSDHGTQPGGRVARPGLMRLPAVAALIVLLAALVGCGPAASPAPQGTLTLLLLAGPVCPVETDPPDPRCAPRPVSAAVVAILDGDREVARGTSGAEGRIDFRLPVGRYTVRAVPGDAPFPVPPGDQVVDVGAGPVELRLDYDTGIR
jgi:hypothetical protein